MLKSASGLPTSQRAVAPPAFFPDLTVIVPTLNEAQALPLLLSGLAERYPGAHVIVADDDSQDGTRERAEGFRGPLQVRVLHRRGDDIKGLTAAVVDALKLVRTPYFIVMDADLQHPPESVHEVYLHASNGAHLAVGRRLNDHGLTASRRVASRGARGMARTYLRLSGKPAVDDPMSGFFGGKTAFVRQILARHEHEFEKPGFKVLVDLLRFAPPETKVEEVPYSFGQRAAGHSKLRLGHMLSLLRQLGPVGRGAAAVVGAVTARSFWKFAAVGASGVLVNQALLALGHGWGGLPLLLASALAIETALLWNFTWNDRWSFAGMGRGIGITRRLARFHLHSVSGAVANAGVLWALVQVAGIHYLLANLAGIAVAMGWNWAFAHRWTWGQDAPRTA